MKAHELTPNNFYRAEKRSTLDGSLMTDVAYAFMDCGVARVRFACYVGSINPLAWEYFGPLSLQTKAELRDEIFCDEAEIISEMEQ